MSWLLFQHLFYLPRYNLCLGERNVSLHSKCWWVILWYDENHMKIECFRTVCLGSTYMLVNSGTGPKHWPISFIKYYFQQLYSHICISLILLSNSVIIGTKKRMIPIPLLVFHLVQALGTAKGFVYLITKLNSCVSFKSMKFICPSELW